MFNTTVSPTLPLKLGDRGRGVLLAQPQVGLHEPRQPDNGGEAHGEAEEAAKFKWKSKSTILKFKA